MMDGKASGKHKSLPPEFCLPPSLSSNFNMFGKGGKHFGGNAASICNLLFSLKKRQAASITLLRRAGGSCPPAGGERKEPMTDTEQVEPGFVLVDANGRLWARTSFFTSDTAARTTAEAMKLEGYEVRPAKRVTKPSGPINGRITFDRWPR